MPVTPESLHDFLPYFISIALTQNLKIRGKNSERGARREADTYEVLQILVWKEMSVREAAHSPNVPKSLLQDQRRRMKKRSEAKPKPELHWFENTLWEEMEVFLISNFRRVLNVVCFLLGNSPASEFYMPTFWNTFFIPAHLWRWNRQSVPKRRHKKFRRRAITQK
jgi:hypothetical protein